MINVYHGTLLDSYGHSALLRTSAIGCKKWFSVQDNDIDNYLCLLGLKYVIICFEPLRKQWPSDESQTTLEQKKNLIFKWLNPKYYTEYTIFTHRNMDDQTSMSDLNDLETQLLEIESHLQEMRDQFQNLSSKNPIWIFDIARPTIWNFNSKHICTCR